MKPDKKALMGMKYFILFLSLLYGVFVYAGLTGWQVFDSTRSEKFNTHQNGRIRNNNFHHK